MFSTPDEIFVAFVIFSCAVCACATLVMRRWSLAAVLALTALVICVWAEGMGMFHPIRPSIITVQAEQRNIAVALESFRVFEGRLPTQREYYDGTHWNDGIPDDVPEATMTLTTPVSHIAALPGDPFRNRDYHYGYWTDGEDWILRSWGPDQAETADLERLGRFLYPSVTDATGTPRFAAWPQEMGDWVYDPTNGVKSRGDVIKTGP